MFFYRIYKKYPNLREKVNETLKKRNRLKASMIVSIMIILLAVALSIVTIKIISYMNVDSKNILRILLISFSFLYMGVLTMECLKLITCMDNIKFFYSGRLDESEKRFLEEEIDNCEGSDFDISNVSTDFNWKGRNINNFYFLKYSDKIIEYENY